MSDDYDAALLKLLDGYATDGTRGYGHYFDLVKSHITALVKQAEGLGHYRACLEHQGAEVALIKRVQKAEEQQAILSSSYRSASDQCDEYSDYLRSLCAQLSVGGWNSEGRMPVNIAESKINDGIELLVQPWMVRVEKAEAQVAELTQELEDTRMFLNDTLDGINDPDLAAAQRGEK